MKTVIRDNWIRFAVVCLLYAVNHPFRSNAAAVPVFGPAAAQTNLNGNSFLTPFDTPDPARFQQVFDSSLFGALPGGGYIATVSFRVDATSGHSFMATIPTIQLSFSTTTRAADGLSAIFSENIGPDVFTVLGPGSVELSGAGGGGFTGFHVSFIFDSNPFFYNPADGNLLLDFQIFDGLRNGTPPGIAILDAFMVSGDGISSVYGSGATMPSSGLASTVGLATALRIIPVPEPSTYSLCAVGLGLLWLTWRKRQSRKEARRVAA